MALAIFGAALATPLAADPFETTIRPFLETHCVECHGPETQESNLRFDAIEAFQASDVHLWTKVHEALSYGDMPPDDEPRPDPEAAAAVLAWIEAEQRAPQPGRIRRMNRRELNATLRDLTALSVDFAGGLPEDGKVAGFDTGAEGLQDAADSVAQIMEVTRRAVAGIRFLEPPPGEPVILDFREERFKDLRRGFNDIGKSDAGISSRGQTATWLDGRGLLLTPAWIKDRDSFSINVRLPEDGRGIVRLAVDVSAEEGMPGVPAPRLAVRAGGRDFGVREISGRPDSAERMVFEFQFEDLATQKDGLEISLRNLVEMPYAVEGFENEDRTKPEDNVPGGGGLFRPLFDKKELKPEERPVPQLVIESMEIELDRIAAWPPETWQAKSGEIADDLASARRLLALWTERAWRRPVQSAELEPFLEFYQTLRRDGLSFDDALRATFQSVLLSGPFRFLASPADEDPAIAPHAIATRLAFMLTGGPPDAELRQLAAEGKLRDPAVLDTQVDRLLADPRLGNFSEPFVVQWLEMEQPITVLMDDLRQVDFLFGRYLKESMRTETVAYFQTMLAKNRPARELVDSHWTVMNDSLARHYGYPGIDGSAFRAVSLRKDDPRGGGILGHAGIQSMLTWMGDNWVIYRGAWALRHILDMPPPPAPLEVPELDLSGDNRHKPFRELLRQHQEDPNCTVCHKHMDPLGFAFQNFDPAGRWREVEFSRYIKNEIDGKIQWLGDGETRPVDTLGRLPRGEEFTTFAECKQLIATHYMDDVVAGWMKNLVIYGTGRQPDVDDLAAIREMIKQHKAAGHPVRDLLKALIRSRVFLDR